MRRALLTAGALAILALGVIAYRLIEPRSNILTPPTASNGVDYVLYVHVPSACLDGGCNALYVLDGLAWLPTFARIEDELIAQYRMEPQILVGIGYRNALNTGDLRKHDFTPAFGRTPNRTGGAETFLSVLRDEIIPYAEAHLPIDSTRRGLAGHSYAGLFTAYTLAQAPDLFERYLIMSPALWFDDSNIFALSIAPRETEAFVFLGADTPRDARSEMAQATLRLNELYLRQRNLTVSHALFFDKTHNSMVGPAARQGLVTLFASETP